MLIFLCVQVSLKSWRANASLGRTLEVAGSQLTWELWPKLPAFQPQFTFLSTKPFLQLVLCLCLTRCVGWMGVLENAGTCELLHEEAKCHLWVSSSGAVHLVFWVRDSHLVWNSLIVLRWLVSFSLYLPGIKVTNPYHHAWLFPLDSRDPVLVLVLARQALRLLNIFPSLRYS